MTDEFLTYSSITLYAMSSVTLALSILFRQKSHNLNSLPQNLEANTFNKTFIIFNPYGDKRKIIHRTLTLLPFAVAFASIGLTLAFFLLIQAGFLLSILTITIALNMIMLEAMPEAYLNSATFTKVIKTKSNIGIGDIKLYHTLRHMMPKLSNYYLALSILFIAFSTALPFIWPSLITLFTEYVNLIFQASLAVDGFAYVLATFLYALTLFIIELASRNLTRRSLRYLTT
jgi:hypothetical protein